MSTNLAELTIDQLRDLANNPPQDPPANEPVVAAPDPEDVEQIIVRDEIDLGDGSGIQVFEGVGDTVEEARAAQVAKLLEAQKNATRKIRELSAPKPAAPAAPTFNPEEEALLSQRLMSEPSKVLAEIRDQAVKDAEERIRKQQEAERQAAEQANQAALAFVGAHPDYYACPQNEARIERYLKLNGWAFTLENIERAYTDLNTDGLLAQKPGPKTTPQPRSSTISTRSSATPPLPQDVREKAKSMTLEQLREAAGGYVYPTA